ncbi:MAG: PLP-dependent aminotransferase family protein [Actinobacteria bacterium]|nr:PLP-dependent aminotransferase family protein [Actinomycetota bacterium]
MNRATSGLSDEASGDGRELLLDFHARRGQLRSEMREALRAAIQDGRLRAGTVLPASRRLAAQLGVSRGVVSDTYDQLVCEGYLELTPRSAPVVAAVAAATPAAREPAAPRWRFDFTATTPDVGLFPRRSWARAVQRAVAAAPDASLDYGDHHGRAELRTALAKYLGRVRGVRADPARIVVTQGFTQALDLICHVLAESGRTTVAMESPSHPGLWVTVRQSGATLAGCPVDERGLQVDALAGLGPDAVVVAPAHQFPTGAVMAPDRRLALIEWAQARNRLVIEDDYDAEFRYDRTPVGALQGLDPSSVAHVGTVSKTLAPGVRLGWITAPASLIDGLVARKSAADSGSPAIDQLAFADLLSSGEYERHIGATRRAYRRRRDHLVRELTALLPALPVRGAAAGMQLLLELPSHADDSALAEAAAAQGIKVSPLTPLHLTPSRDRALLVGFGRLPEHNIPAAVGALASVLNEAGALPPT